MVVCHCEAINDRTIRDALAAGSTTVDEIARDCGAGSQCGGCVDTIRNLLARAHAPTVTIRT